MTTALFGFCHIICDIAKNFWHMCYLHKQRKNMGWFRRTKPNSIGKGSSRNRFGLAHMLSVAAPALRCCLRPETRCGYKLFTTTVCMIQCSALKSDVEQNGQWKYEHFIVMVVHLQISGFFTALTVQSTLKEKSKADPGRWNSIQGACSS